MSVTFSSLKYFNYRLWFIGALVSNIGTWMQRIGQDWLTLTHLTDHSSLAVGIVTALQFGPAFLFSIPAGLLADRVNRRYLLMVTQGILGSLTLAMGVLTVSGHITLTGIYIFAFLLGCASAIDAPVRQTFVAEMVPPDRLANAVGLNSTSFNSARLIGPGLGGLLIAVFGAGWLFIINAFTFAATIGALLAMRVRQLRPMPRAPKGKGQIRAGIAYVRSRSDLMMLMVVIGVISAFGLNFQLTMAIMSTVEFGKGAGEFGLTGSVMALGTLLGALVAARRERPRLRVVVGGAGAFGLSAAAMALMPTYETFLIACVPTGFFALTMLTAANACVQMSTEPAMRGRVMAIYTMVFLGATPIGSPIIGWVAQTVGPRWSIGIGALISLLVVACAAWWVTHFWKLEIKYRWRTSPHWQVLTPEEAAARVEEEMTSSLRADQTRNTAR